MSKFSAIAMTALLAGSLFVTAVETADAGHHRYNRAGAFALGAIFGAAASAIIAQQSRRYRVRPAVWDRHAVWCARKYKSYNPRNNLFNSYRHGWIPCRSPYWR